MRGMVMLFLAARLRLMIHQQHVSRRIGIVRGSTSRGSGLFVEIMCYLETGQLGAAELDGRRA